MTTKTIASVGLALILTAITFTKADARRHESPATYVPVYDRHGAHGFTPTVHVVVASPRGDRVKRKLREKRKPARPVIATNAATTALSAPLLDRARSYLGTNPTGWARVWCGRFMAMIAPDAARRVGNPNLARAWTALPRTAARIGAIVILARGRSSTAGHIGVVSGFDRAGNPRVVSGNHNRKVAESIYSKHRVIAYVSGG